MTTTSRYVAYYLHTFNLTTHFFHNNKWFEAACMQLKYVADTTVVTDMYYCIWTRTVYNIRTDWNETLMLFVDRSIPGVPGGCTVRLHGAEKEPGWVCIPWGDSDRVQFGYIGRTRLARWSSMCSCTLVFWTFFFPSLEIRESLSL